MIVNNTSPHENEYLAAVAGLGEQTPSPSPTFAIGDRLTYRLEGDGNGFRVGRVSEVSAANLQLCIEEEGTGEKHGIDWRPWPTDNVLPF